MVPAPLSAQKEPAAPSTVTGSVALHSLTATRSAIHWSALVAPSGIDPRPRNRWSARDGSWTMSTLGSSKFHSAVVHGSLCRPCGPARRVRGRDAVHVRGEGLGQRRGAVDDALGLATATTEGGAELGLGRGEGARLAAEEQPAAIAASASISPGSSRTRRVLMGVSSSRVSGSPCPSRWQRLPRGHFRARPMAPNWWRPRGGASRWPRCP